MNKTPSKVPQAGETVVLTKEMASHIASQYFHTSRSSIRRALRCIASGATTVIPTPDEAMVERVLRELRLMRYRVAADPTEHDASSLIALITGKPSLTVGGAGLKHDAASRASLSTRSRSLKE